MKMRLFEISNRGLLLVAMLTAALWSVIFMQRALDLSAQHDYNELRESFRATPVITRPEPLPAPQPMAARPVEMG